MKETKNKNHYELQVFLFFLGVLTLVWPFFVSLEGWPFYFSYIFYFIVWLVILVALMFLSKGKGENKNNNKNNNNNDNN